MGQFWDNIFTIDTLQYLIGIGGIFFYQCDIVNAAIYFLRQRWKESVLSLCSAVIPLAGSKAIKKMAGIGNLEAVLGSDDVVTDLYFRYLADENSMELLSEIGSLSDKTLRSMGYSTSGMGIAEGILYKDLTITAEVVDSEGSVIGKVKVGGKKDNKGVIKSPSDIARSWQGKGKYPGIDDYTDVTVKKGTILYRGEPNGSEYFTTLDAIETSDRDAKIIFEGLQVEKHPIYGYRGEMEGYLFNEDIIGAYGIAKANPHFGKGGLEQYFIPDVHDLIDKGILTPVHNIKLH